KKCTGFGIFSSRVRDDFRAFSRPLGRPLKVTWNKQKGIMNGRIDGTPISECGQERAVANGLDSSLPEFLSGWISLSARTFLMVPFASTDNSISTVPGFSSVTQDPEG